MPKVLVVYDSKTGNTENRALAVAKGAEKIMLKRENEIIT
jgi:flavodoxin